MAHMVSHSENQVSKPRTAATGCRKRPSPPFAEADSTTLRSQAKRLKKIKKWRGCDPFNPLKEPHEVVTPSPPNSPKAPTAPLTKLQAPHDVALDVRHYHHQQAGQGEQDHRYSLRGQGFPGSFLSHMARLVWKEASKNSTFVWGALKTRTTPT